MKELAPLAGHQAARIEVRDSPLHGLGVFACVDLPKGSLIERCFYLVIDDDDLHEINRLNDYLFTSPDVGKRGEFDKPVVNIGNLPFCICR